MPTPSPCTSCTQLHSCLTFHMPHPRRRPYGWPAEAACVAHVMVMGSYESYSLPLSNLGLVAMPHGCILCTRLQSCVCNHLAATFTCNPAQEAVWLGRQLLSRLGLFHHVRYEHTFQDDYLFYRSVRHAGYACADAQTTHIRRAR